MTETIVSEWLYGRLSATDGFQVVIDTAISLTVDIADDTQTATSEIAVEIFADCTIATHSLSGCDAGSKVIAINGCFATVPPAP